MHLLNTPSKFGISHNPRKTRQIASGWQLINISYSIAIVIMKHIENTLTQTLKFILMSVILFSCQKKDDIVSISIRNSPPLGDPRIYLIVQDQTSGANRFDSSENTNWTIDQVKTEQVLASG